jgi:amidophosphoribosyltransferase
MATKTELIGANLGLEEIKEHIGADSLGYLSLDGLNSAINTGKDTLCNACFTGKYPLDVQERLPLAIAEL